MPSYWMPSRPPVLRALARTAFLMFLCHSAEPPRQQKLLILEASVASPLDWHCLISAQPAFPAMYSSVLFCTSMA
eukprot:3277795-Pyramimonas_sp.AAC.1